LNPEPIDIKKFKNFKEFDLSQQSLCEILLILAVLDESYEIVYGSSSYTDKIFTLHKEDL